MLLATLLPLGYDPVMGHITADDMAPVLKMMEKHGAQAVSEVARLLAGMNDLGEELGRLRSRVKELEGVLAQASRELESGRHSAQGSHPVAVMIRRSLR